MSSAEVEFLVIGGYAVNYYGYTRATGDLKPAGRMPVVWQMWCQFGFAGAKPDDFLQAGKIVRMGVPPVRLEILTSISGVDFRDCYPRRVDVDWDGVRVPVIHRDDLVRNKRASGRLKDRLDLEQLS